MLKKDLALLIAMHKNILSDCVHTHKDKGLVHCRQQIEDFHVTFLEFYLKRLELQFDLLWTVHRC